MFKSRGTELHEMRTKFYIKNILLTFFSVLPDQYKPDPRDAAGTRSEQLSDSDGWSAH